MILTETLSDDSVYRMDSAAFTKHPDVKLAQGQIRKASHSLKMAKSSYAPTLSILYQGNLQVAGNDFLALSNG